MALQRGISGYSGCVLARIVDAAIPIKVRKNSNEIHFN
jgi:hypothetical protein